MTNHTVIWSEVDSNLKKYKTLKMEVKGDSKSDLYFQWVYSDGTPSAVLMQTEGIQMSVHTPPSELYDWRLVAFHKFPSKLFVSTDMIAWEQVDLKGTFEQTFFIEL